MMKSTPQPQQLLSRLLLKRLTRQSKHLRRVHPLKLSSNQTPIMLSSMALLVLRHPAEVAVVEEVASEEAEVATEGATEALEAVNSEVNVVATEVAAAEAEKVLKDVQELREKALLDAQDLKVLKVKLMLENLDPKVLKVKLTLENLDPSVLKVKHT